MPEINDVEKLYNLILVSLRANAPRLSGNTKSSIHTSRQWGREFTIVIDPDYYDVNLFKQTGRIQKVAGKHGSSSYAQSVNEKGAFGSHNKSMHWINKVVVNCAEQIASEIGAVVINELGF